VPRANTNAATMMLAEKGAEFSGVHSVGLPEELDRPEIVTRTGPDSVPLAEFGQGSDPLHDTVMRVIGQDLASFLPGGRVAAYPWPPGTSVDRAAHLDYYDPVLWLLWAPWP
jgi:uncharacterized protein